MSILTSALPSFSRGKTNCWNSSGLHQCFWTQKRWMHNQVIFISVTHLITAVSSHTGTRFLMYQEQSSSAGTCSSTSEHLPLSLALGSGAPTQISQSSACAPSQNCSGAPNLAPQFSSAWHHSSAAMTNSPVWPFFTRWLCADRTKHRSSFFGIKSGIHLNCWVFKLPGKPPAWFLLTDVSIPFAFLNARANNWKAIKITIHKLAVTGKKSQSIFQATALKIDHHL